MSNQLIQFKCHSFKDWIEQYNDYIPLAGELCGFIILNDEEKNDVQDLIPNGYEQQATPYTLLKMGDGITSAIDLPWAGLTDEKVVNQLINNIVNSEESSALDEKIIKLIQTSTANWNQNDANQLDYIKNKICQEHFEDIPQPINIMLPGQYRINRLNNFIYFQYKSYEDIDHIEKLINDKNMFSCLLGETEFLAQEFLLQVKYENQIKYLDNAPVECYSFGNIAHFPEIINFESDITFSSSELPIGGLIVLTDQKCFIAFYIEDEYINNQGEVKSTFISIDLIKQSKNIETINNKWLPKEVFQGCDWNADGAEDIGFIKNKICKIHSYENVQGTPINIKTHKEGEVNGVVFYSYSSIDYNQAMPEFFTTNKYSIEYRDAQNNTYYLNNIKPIEVELFDEDVVYLLGNPYLAFLYNYNNSGGFYTPNNPYKNYLISYPDNNFPVCGLYFPHNRSYNFLFRPEKKEKNIGYIYSYNKSGILVDAYHIKIDNINLIEDIKEKMQNTDFVDYNDFVLMFNNNYYTINDITYNENINSSYIFISTGIHDTTKLNNITITQRRHLGEISITLSQVPKNIKTIDPIWLPTQYKVGKLYTDNSSSYLNSAEIFNDYTNNKATNYYAHAEGENTIAQGRAQHVQGKYNLPNTNSSFIIGNGKNEESRSNAVEIDWEGNAKFKGNIQAKNIQDLNGITLEGLQIIEQETKIWELNEGIYKVKFGNKLWLNTNEYIYTQNDLIFIYKDSNNNSTFWTIFSAIKENDLAGALNVQSGVTIYDPVNSLYTSNIISELENNKYKLPQFEYYSEDVSDDFYPTVKGLVQYINNTINQTKKYRYSKDLTNKRINGNPVLRINNEISFNTTNNLYQYRAGYRLLLAKAANSLSTIKQTVKSPFEFSRNENNLIICNNINNIIDSGLQTNKTVHRYKQLIEQYVDGVNIKSGYVSRGSAMGTTSYSVEYNIILYSESKENLEQLQKIFTSEIDLAEAIILYYDTNNFIEGILL